MSIFYLPDLGEGLPDAEIHQWYVKEGDEVTLDQPLVSMETAKAVVDVPAPQSGRITKLHGKPGDVIKTGAPLIEFASAGASAHTKASATISEDSGTVVGNIVVGTEVVKETAIIGRSHQASTSTSAGVKAVPAVRALAQRLGIELSTLSGTGPNQTITLEDVQKAANGKSGTPRTTQSHTTTAAVPEGFEALQGVRRIMARTMTQSHEEVAAVTIVDDADIHRWTSETDITARLIRAVVQGCKTEPAINAWFDTASQSRRLWDTVHLGIAMDSEDGLFVPVLKDAGQKSAKDYRETINRFKTQIKNRDIPQEDLKGATITLSNFGNFAGRYATPVIVPPTVAILGSGRLRDTVVAMNNEVKIHRIIPLSLSVDHRAVTGGEAARFLRAVIDDLEKAE